MTADAARNRDVLRSPRCHHRTAGGSHPLGQPQAKDGFIDCFRSSTPISTSVVIVPVQAINHTALGIAEHAHLHNRLPRCLRAQRQQAPHGPRTGTIPALERRPRRPAHLGTATTTRLNRKPPRRRHHKRGYAARQRARSPAGYSAALAGRAGLGEGEPLR